MLISLKKGEKKIKYKHKLNDQVKCVKACIWRESIGEHENIPDTRVAHEKENPNVENGFPPDVRANY